VITVGDGGEATARVTELLTGNDAAAWRADLRAATQEERERLFAEDRASRIAPGAQLSHFAATPLDREDAPLELTYELALPSFARPQSGSARGTLPFIRSLVRDLGGRPSRRWPAVLAIHYDDSIAITVVPPPGRIVRTADSDGRAQFSQCSASRRITEAGGALNVRQELRLDAVRIAPEDYRAFTEFAAAADDLSTVEIEVVDRAE